MLRVLKFHSNIKIPTLSSGNLEVDGPHHSTDRGEGDSDHILTNQKIVHVNLKPRD